VDPLAWLGLRKPKTPHGRLAAIQSAVRALLPDDEAVLVRYIVIVSALLTRVAHADGVFLQCELDHLRALFRHVDQLPAEGIDELCGILNEQVPKLDDEELTICYRELRTLCNADERMQIMRLLAEQATADGQIAPSEHTTLMEVAEALGISADAIATIEDDALEPHLPLPSGAPPPESLPDSGR
jgi:DnaJ like chaperone protein